MVRTLADRLPSQMHWPVSFKKQASMKDRFPISPVDGGIYVTDVPALDTWKAMEALVKKGKIRSIGVSNFTRERIENINKTAEIKVACNQIEAHPYFQQPEFTKWMQDQGIVVAAYSPLGNNIYNLPRAVDDPVVIDIAEELGKEPAQILVQWAVQRGTVVLPKSVTPARIEANFQDFELPQNAYDKILALDRKKRYNMPIRLGVNVFGELDEPTLKKARADWIEGQRMLQAQKA